MRPYQICSNCVMDTTDTAIVFDDKGVCDHCNTYYTRIEPKWDTTETGKQELARIIDKIKADGKGRDFDCLMGMSGGADSSYMLHLVVKEFGLRPLVFHVDGGWNSELAVRNIEVMIDKLGLDLYTEVINWEEMKDFQLSFFKASVPHIDIPQDMAFIAALYNFAVKHKIKYILNGGNFSTECVNNPKEWIYFGTDMAQNRDIIKQYGTIPLKSFPFSSVLRHKFYLRYIQQIQVVKPLNYQPYIKEKEMQFLKEEYGWQPYEQKHFESRFTRFYEAYWLPRKFGFDTRKVQYASLILTGQMTRDEALEKLKKPAIDDETAKHDFEYVATKLGISVAQLQSYFDAPNKTYRDYKNQDALFQFGTKVLSFIGLDNAPKR
jgi:N-acetyl sugar amidotransferase